MLGENDENKPPQAPEPSTDSLSKVLEALFARQDARDEAREAREIARDEAREKRDEARQQILVKKLDELSASIQSSRRQGMSPRMDPTHAPQMALPPVSFGHAKAYFDTLASPTRKGANVSSSGSIQSTPHNAQQKSDKFTSLYYANLANTYPEKPNILINDMFAYLGSAWAQAYAAVRAEDCTLITDELRDYCRRMKYTDLRSEDHRQSVVNALFKMIEKQLRPKGADGAPGLHWEDKHVRQMPNGRKPDGVIVAEFPGLPTDWSTVAASIEIKSSAHGIEDSVLSGQLLQDFLDMAEHQPRRFMIGLAVASDCKVFVHLCLPHGIYSCAVGQLPSAAETESRHFELIRFVLAMYTALPADLGFLAHTPYGFSSTFKVTDIPGCTVSSEEFKGMDIKLQGGRAFNGRRGRLTGSRSWIYRAQVQSADGTQSSAIFKFIWYSKARSEVDVHTKVQDMDIPYVPRLLHSAKVILPKVNLTEHEEVVGDILVVADAGVGLEAYFASATIFGDMVPFIDVVAGYVHTLLAANNAYGDTHVLHRDISVNNLMVRGGQPVVIDWGFGVIFDHTTLRVASKDAIIGTAPFMGIRVLASHGTRSVIDDLESLFLVLSYLLWSEYGTKNDHHLDLWGGKMEKDKLADNRSNWLASPAEYIKRMELRPTDSKVLALVKQFYHVVFPEDPGIYKIRNDASDPRLAAFDAHALLGVFDAVVEPTGDVQTPCLDKLRRFVDENPRVGFMSEETKTSGKRTATDAGHSSMLPPSKLRY